MSVEAHESMSDAWTRWQGHVINGVFPLGRYLGCSDHSGVFVTRSVGRAPSDVAVKLVPATRAVAESSLPRWKRAAGLSHPHLIRLLEWGGCQLEGLPYLYLVMEYADQTLAQLLQHRALTEDEAREMLPPILDALAFLHGRNQAQGQLKPANILVVGDQLKLASDTIHYITETTAARGTNALSVYDPPEALHGRSSTAGDVWALGVSVFEGLTRRTPSGIREPGDTVVLPADFAPAFRELVSRCLTRRPQDRPRVAELLAFAQGRPSTEGQAATAPAEPATREARLHDSGTAGPAIAEPKAAEPEAVEPKAVEPKAVKVDAVELEVAELEVAEPAVEPRAADPSPVEPRAPNPRSLLAVILGALVILALGWIGSREWRTHRAPTASAPLVQTSGGTSSAIRGAGASAAPTPASAGSATKAGASEVGNSASALRQVIPDVPWSARRTIRGHIKVWVRVIVDPDGSVFAAVLDRTGPSRYFQRLALDAAKKWTFPSVSASVSTPSRRLIQVRFDFGRDGTSGRAVPLR